ncbi:hypothetical protein ACLOJK_003770 [Asimina triloba]
MLGKNEIGRDRRQRERREEDYLLLARSAVVTTIDITNESPIVGIAAAAGGLGTPSSLVKTLLHKVEEEEDNVSTISLVPHPQHLFHCLSPSPMALLAPTLANMPLIANLSNGASDDVMEVGGDVQNCKNTQEDKMMMAWRKKKVIIVIACLLISTSLGLRVRSDYNALRTRGNDCNNLEYGANPNFLWIWVLRRRGSDEELCDGLRKVSVETTEFEGQHTRFIYNSDNEIEGEEEDAAAAEEEACSVSPSILRLRACLRQQGSICAFQHRLRKKTSSEWRWISATTA